MKTLQMTAVEWMGLNVWLLTMGAGLAMLLNG